MADSESDKARELREFYAALLAKAEEAEALKNLQKDRREAEGLHAGLQFKSDVGRQQRNEESALCAAQASAAQITAALENNGGVMGLMQAYAALVPQGNQEALRAMLTTAAAKAAEISTLLSNPPQPEVNPSRKWRLLPVALAMNISILRVEAGGVPRMSN